MKQKIKYFINNYGILIIAVSVCFVIYRFANSIIVKLFNSQNIDKLFQSTITCTSIILGFSGTLITQILPSKREMDKKNLNENNIRSNMFYWFFKTIKPQKISNTILSGVISCIVLIALSLIMLITDVFDIGIKLALFYIWLFVIIIFFYYIINLYRLFITLLFSNDENQLSTPNGENESDIQNCMNAIDNQGKSQ